METRFHINKSCATPIHIQLEEQIHLAIHGGELPPGSRMPTVRGLAVDLGINANTVARVYRDLQERGFLQLQRGAGTFVSWAPPEMPVPRREFLNIESETKRLISLCQDLGLSLAEFTQLAEGLWKETKAT